MAQGPNIHLTLEEVEAIKDAALARAEELEWQLQVELARLREIERNLSQLVGGQRVAPPRPRTAPPAPVAPLAAGTGPATVVDAGRTTRARTKTPLPVIIAPRPSLPGQAAPVAMAPLVPPARLGTPVPAPVAAEPPVTTLAPMAAGVPVTTIAASASGAPVATIAPETSARLPVRLPPPLPPPPLPDESIVTFQPPVKRAPTRPPATTLPEPTWLAPSSPRGRHGRK